MSDPAGSLGRRIALHRTRRGMSQRDLAAAVGRSEGWVSQVERGARTVDRMSVLRSVADALGVPVVELASETPIIATTDGHPEPVRALRAVLADAAALRYAAAPGPAVPLSELVGRVDRAWDLAHAADTDQLVPLLVELIPDLETAARSARGQGRRAAYVALARAYHAAAAAAAKLDAAPAAWVAADRAIRAAESAGDPLLIAAGAFRLTLALQRTRQYDEAERAASSAHDALDLMGDTGPAATSLRGALLLQLAVIAARRRDPDVALARLDAADAAAATLDGYRDHHDLEFGPANVDAHRVAVAVELGDPTTALRVAAGLDTTGMSPERRSRLLVDVARAHLQRRHPDGAIAAVEDAVRIAPAVARHQLVVALLRDLTRAGHSRDPRVRALLRAGA